MTNNKITYEQANAIIEQFDFHHNYDEAVEAVKSMFINYFLR